MEYTGSDVNFAIPKGVTHIDSFVFENFANLFQYYHSGQYCEHRGFLISIFTPYPTHFPPALEAGMDIKVLSSILGHAQASTTLNLYAHALPDHKRQSMEKMGTFYGNALCNTV